MKKVVEAFEVPFMGLKKRRNRRLANDILYYLRKLLKLARELQKMSLIEGVDLGDFDAQVDSIMEEVEQLEKDMRG